MKLPVDPVVFFKTGLAFVAQNEMSQQCIYQICLNNTYLSFFGLNLEQTSHLWSLVELPKGYAPAHILWALSFLRLYWTETQLEALAGVTPKTLRKRVWVVIEAIASITSKVVSL